MFRFTGLVVPALLALVFASTALAANPKVTLRITNATAAEAARQLGQAAGVEITVAEPGGPPGAPPQAEAGRETAGFNWNGVPLGTALRELCNRFGLRCSGGGDRYTLSPGAARLPNAAPPKRVGLFERKGVRLYARAVSIMDNRSRVLVDDAPQVVGGMGGLNLSVVAELGELDRDSVQGVENAVARDDLGNILAEGDQRGIYSSGSSSSFPDEWSGTIRLPAPHPAARKLEWVEGDLVVYRRVNSNRLEFPLPHEGKSARKQLGHTLVVVTTSQAAAPSRQEEADDEEGLPQFRRAFTSPSGLQVRVRLYTPEGERRGALPNRAGFTTTLIGSSGRSYTAQPFSTGTSGNGEWRMSDLRYNFLAARNDPPVKLVLSVLEREDPVKLFSFRMANIPLPEPGGSIARRTVSPRPGMSSTPFQQQGGGSLVSQVDILGRPASEGALQVGLAARGTDGEWGPLRWTSLEVDETGVARLEDLKPGTYRVMRQYRPAEGAVPPRKGARWLAAEVVVAVVAGKEAALPPLRWTAEPAAAKPPGTKPSPPRRPTLRPSRKATGTGRR